MKEVHTINYYPINEGAARRAKEMNSFSDYKEVSATAEWTASGGGLPSPVSYTHLTLPTTPYVPLTQGFPL